jgi:hypothetical protein
MRNESEVMERIQQLREQIDGGLGFPTLEAELGTLVWVLGDDEHSTDCVDQENSRTDVDCERDDDWIVKEDATQNLRTRIGRIVQR